MSGRVTIKSIAKDLGISHMTVSRALSNHPNVLKETREAVQKRARELGYVKSAAAMAMRGDGTKIVGLLLPNIVNEFYARFANTMALACEKNSYQLIIHLTNDDIEVEQQALDRLREVQAQAVVLVPAPGEQKTETYSQKTMRIIQLIRRRKQETPVNSLLVEDGPAICEAVLHLARNGHERIAYIGGDAGLSSGRSRLAAFQKGLQRSNLTMHPDLIRTGKPSFLMGRDHAQDLLEATQATALVCGGFEVSNGALNACMDASQFHSKSMVFVGYGDPTFYTWINGGVSTIRVPVDRLAKKAVMLIAENTAPDVPQNISFDASLVIRGQQ